MKWLCLPLVAALSLSAAPASATSVTPINIEMSAGGPKARAHIVVTNTGGDPIAIEPTVALTVVSETGKALTSPADGDFLILPTQALIAPGAAQTFRVQWLGGPGLAESRSYLVTMNELPVRGLSGRAGLRLVMSFAVAVNVAPVGGRGALHVASSGVTAGRKPFVVLDNPTATHALLKDADITVTGDGWTTTLPAGSLQTMLGTGLVQPRHRRTFTLPVDVPARVRTLTVAVDYRPGT